MFKQLLSITALASVSLSAHAAINIGEEIPNLTVTDHTGTTHHLADFKDKTVVLEWTNYGCPFVRKHYDSDNMQTLQETYNDENIVWLSVISSAPGKQGHLTAENAATAIEQEGFAGDAVVLDPAGDLGRAFGAVTTPHMFIINDNRVAYNGAIDSIPSFKQDDIERADNYVAMGLDELANDQPISTPQTKPYGCSVKY